MEIVKTYTKELDTLGVDFLVVDQNDYVHPVSERWRNQKFSPYAEVTFRVALEPSALWKQDELRRCIAEWITYGYYSPIDRVITHAWLIDAHKLRELLWHQGIRLTDAHGFKQIRLFDLYKKGLILDEFQRTKELQSAEG